MIEKIKYDNLVSNAKKLNLHPMYISSTPKGIYAFYLNDINIKWYEKKLPKTTEFNDNSDIIKTIGMLHYSKGIDLTKKFPF